MTSLFRKPLWLLAVVLLSSAGSALAIPVVGVPTEDGVTTTPTGSVDGSGRIYFYIPLTDVTETYGVAGGGLSSDTCSLQSGSSTCTGGTLEMFLYFPVAGAGSYLLNIDFGDFDAIGVNDPWFFLEALEIYDADGFMIASIAADADLLSSSTNVTQAYELLLSGIAGPFHIRLVFQSSFDVESPYGSYRNTSEDLLASVTSVPEPGTLVLFGMGLLMMGVSGARRRQRQRI